MPPTTEKAPKLRFPEFNGGWNPRNLEDVAEKIQDGTHFSPQIVDGGEFKYITSRNIRNGYMDLDEVFYINEPAHREIYRRCDVKLSDVLITKDGASTGNVCLNELNEEFSLLSSVAFVRADNKNATNKFIYHYIFSPKGQREIKKVIAGQAITRITLTKLRNFKFKFPSLPEQKKIADFLSAVDKKIRQLTRKKELLEQYKKGVMQKIFSQEIRFDYDGLDYHDWPMRKLGSICECLDNRRVPLNESQRSRMRGGIPYWGANNILDYVDDFIFDDTIVLLAEDGGYFDEFADRPIAQISYGKAWVNNHAHVLKGKAELDTEFLYYSLVHKNILGYVNVGTRSKLNKSDMLRIKIAVPPVSLQKKVVKMLKAVDKKIKVVSDSTYRVRQFKKGLLQQMFV